MLAKNIKKSLVIVVIAVLLVIPCSSVLAQSSNPVPVGIFTEHTISPDNHIEIPIEVKNVNGLYALDIALEFDPSILQAEDADPANAGIQMALGNFLDPGMVLFNTIDNETGTAHFVMTQANPSEGKTGNGILLVIYFKAIKQGNSALTFTNAQLSTRDGLEIPSAITNSVINVIVNAPTVVATAIPVQNPESLIQIPTEMPTATATLAPTPTPMAQGGQIESTANPEGAAIEAGSEDTSSGFSFSSIWWIVLILFVLVLAAGIYLILSRKKKQPDEKK